MKVAVYGSLMKGLYNHKQLGDNPKYLGEFYSEPVFSLYAVSTYPGLKRNGSTSVRFEVYDISVDDIKNVDRLEGYYGKNSSSNLYNKFVMNSPYGKVICYEYNKSINKDKLVESGNWKEYYERTIDKQFNLLET